MNKPKKIVVTNEKGGTGKSTIIALLVEYLNFLNKKVQVIDTDPIQSSQDWVDNCASEGRIVSQTPADYQIIDTAGSSGSALAWLKEADLIVVPLQMNYTDLKVTSDWFTTLNKTLQNKIFFLPNRWQNTKEQREALKQLQEISQEEKAGKILSFLSNRPALYGELLNGSKENFFTKKSSEEAQKLVKSVVG